MEWIQTHISHVFRTRARVVKLRKAVELGFLDFGRRAARNADALREVALNRRLAPDVYRGVAPVRRGPRGHVVGPVGESLAAEGDALEHAVVMQRLPDGCDARSLLDRGALGAEHLDAVARVLADFHAAHGLGRPAPWSPEAWRERTAAPMRANFVSLRKTPPPGLEPARVEAVAAATEQRLEALAPALERRRLEGRAVDGHGDVHLEHVWFVDDGPPRLIDCIEFDDDLRHIDAASEIAFLAMDLGYRRRRPLGERFLRSYATYADDFGAFEVVDLFAAYRAGVRAKVAGLAAAEPEIDRAQREAAAASAVRHLELAAQLLRPPQPGALILVCGTVGVGKSTVAAALAERLEAPVVASDRTRKRLAGLAPTARPDAAAERRLYAPETTERVYEALLARADPVIRGGRAVVLDATWSSARHREAARRRAEALGARFALVHVDCEEAVARARLAERDRRGDDPSDAGPERLAQSRAAFEALDAVPPALRRELRSDAADPEAALDALVRWLRPR